MLGSPSFLPVFPVYSSNGFLLLTRTDFPINNVSRVILKSLFTGPCVSQEASGSGGFSSGKADDLM